MDVLGGMGFLFILVLAAFGWGVYQQLLRQGRFDPSPSALSRSQLNGRLKQTLKTSEQDWTENRNGRLSPSQKQKLREMYPPATNQIRYGTILTVGLILLIVILMGVIYAPLVLQTLREMPFLGFFYAGFLGFMVYMGIYAPRRYLTITQNLPEQPLQSMEGRIRLRRVYGRYGTRVHMVSIRQHTFYLTKEQFAGLVVGGKYRVYYVRFYGSNLFISAEAIE